MCACATYSIQYCVQSKATHCSFNVITFSLNNFFAFFLLLGIGCNWPFTRSRTSPLSHTNRKYSHPKPKCFAENKKKRFFFLSHLFAYLWVLFMAFSHSQFSVFCVCFVLCLVVDAIDQFANRHRTLVVRTTDNDAMLMCVHFCPLHDVVALRWMSNALRTVQCAHNWCTSQSIESAPSWGRLRAYKTWCPSYFHAANRNFCERA